MAATVTVALKMPHGLHLRLFKQEEYVEAVIGGGTRLSTRAVQVGEIVTLNGYAAPHGMSPKAPVVAGFALTHSVDAEFFAEWMKQNAELDVVKNGLVFSYEKPGMVDGRAKEHSGLRNGLEPLSRDGDPRAPRKVATADLKAA